MNNLRNITPELSAIQTGTRGFKDENGNYFLTALGGDFVPAGQGAATVFYKCASVNSSAQTWTGYKAVLSNGVYSFESTATTGLSYTTATPEVGKIYSTDALIGPTKLYDGMPTSGLVFYAPLYSSQVIAETQQILTETNMSFIDGSAYFNGSAYIDFSAVALPFGETDRTISCWIKLSSTPSDDYAVLFYGPTNSTYHAFNFAIDSTRKVKVDTWSHDIRGNTSIPLNTWTHVCAVISSKNATIYVNGVSDTEGVLSNMDTSQYATACIGARVNSRDSRFDGYMQGCRIYNRALTASEITALASEFTPSN